LYFHAFLKFIRISKIIKENKKLKLGHTVLDHTMAHLVINLFTRKVYLEYRQVFDKSAAFRMYPNLGVPNGFLVKHQWGGRGFYWSNDAFRVYADVVQGEYRCECRQWKHTSKFLNNYNNMFCICHDSCHCNIPATPGLVIVTSDSYLGS
jgi:hypothetical protein